MSDPAAGGVTGPRVAAGSAAEPLPASVDPRGAGRGFADPLVAAGVVALVRLYAARAATPVDATRACLARIERHDPALHAFLDVDTAGAIAAAEASAARWAAGAPRSPIDGVPIGVKANIAVHGLPWTGGWAARRGVLAAADAACVARLRAAGAVLLGTLNMDEAALGASGDNPWYGRTANPHGADRSPGGSSAGAAAAVAAGLCAAALGTDTMGSVRIPAACCGVVGLSPRRGTIDGGGVVPLSWRFDNVGVLARSVDDVACVLDVVEGSGLSGAVGDAGVQAQPALDAGRLAVAAHAEAVPAGRDLAVLVGLDGVTPDPAVLRAFEAAKAGAVAAGFRLHPVRLDGFDARAALKAVLLVVEAEAAAAHEVLLREQPDSVSVPLRRMLDWGARQPAVRLAAAQHELHDSRSAIRQQLAPFAGLLLPVVPRSSFGFDEPQPQIAAYTVVGSLTGLAGLSLPMALPGESAPGAVQIVGADNASTLAIGRALARELLPVGAPPAFTA